MDQSGLIGNLYLFQFDTFLIYTQAYTSGGSKETGLALLATDRDQHIDINFTVPITDRYAIVVTNYEKIDLLHVTLIKGGRERIDLIESLRKINATMLYINSTINNLRESTMYTNKTVNSLINFGNLNFTVNIIMSSAITYVSISAISYGIKLVLKRKKNSI